LQFAPVDRRAQAIGYLPVGRSRIGRVDRHSETPVLLL
jgi:hypothetical protein